MRRLLRYILFLLLSIAPLAAQTADPPVKPDSSTWWYPLGNMEGTRRNPAPTLADGPDDLVVKWRTTALRNSPTILVGALRPAVSDFTQQIVGIVQHGPLDQMATNDTIVAINDHGFVDWRKNYFPTVLSTPHRLTLTGLFNFKNRTPRPIGRPTTIGIGVERVTPAAPNKVFGILASPDSGSTIQQLVVPRVEGTDSNNTRVAVYPTAMFRPYGSAEAIVLGLVSQNTFHPQSGSDKNANKLIKYKLGGEPEQLASIPIAPKTYPQAPALHTSRNDSLHYIGVSTASLMDDPPISATIPGTGISTSSALQYSIDVQIPPPDPKDSLRLIEAREMPKGAAGIKSTELRGETDTYFVKMFFKKEDDTAEVYKVMTTNHGPKYPGVPVLMLSDAEQALATPYQTVVDTNVRNVGWTIVAADIDGTDQVADPSIKDGLINTPGDELLAAYRNLDGSDVQKNVFFAYKRRDPSVFANGAIFSYFVRWSFSGRLMAAADLVRDAANRQELVFVDVDTLRIYQLKSYDALRAQHGDNPFPFNEIKSFVLDSRIVSVAIADLHGVGYNDIIVTTEQSTYAIGRPIPQPLGTVAVADEQYCPGSTATVTWGPRIVGGGEEGMTVMIRNAEGKDSVLQDGVMTSDSMTTFSFSTAKLPLGNYSIVVHDKAVPGLTAIGGSFRIVAASIEGVKLPQSQYGPDEEVTFTTKYRCADHLILERSDSSDDAWYQWPAVIGYDTATATATVSTTIPCFDPCRTNGQTRIFFRLRDTAIDLPPSESDRFTFIMPDRPITVDTTSPRVRRIAWSPSQFDCDSVDIALSLGGTPLNLGISAATGRGYADVELPRGLAGDVSVRVCCGDDIGNPCDYGLGAFEVEPLEPGNYAQPNPFDPNTVENVSIFYTLDKGSPVTVTIFDASRALVRRLISGAEREAGLNMETWDGRNSLGEIVANGTYICIIESGSGRLTPLPIFIMKH